MTAPLLNGTYLVTQRLGSGGFGEVFLAEDTAIPNRRVAIKVLAQSPLYDQSNLVWEMTQLAELRHPHVISFYHHFTEESRLFLVMEYCAGGSLDQRLLPRLRLSVPQYPL